MAVSSALCVDDTLETYGQCGCSNRNVLLAAFIAPDKMPSRIQTTLIAPDKMPSRIQTTLIAPDKMPARIQTTIIAPDKRPSRIQTTIIAPDKTRGHAPLFEKTYRNIVYRPSPSPLFWRGVHKISSGWKFLWGEAAFLWGETASCGERLHISTVKWLFSKIKIYFLENFFFIFEIYIPDIQCFEYFMEKLSIICQYILKINSFYIKNNH